jgi:hypothetical protein
MAFRIVLEISTRSDKFIEPTIWSVELTAANVGRFGCERVTTAERETSWRFNDGKGAPQFTQIFAGGDGLSEFFVGRMLPPPRHATRHSSNVIASPDDCHFRPTNS